MALLPSRDRPTITAIVPAYNAAKYLDDALQSLFRQTHPPSQILVIDDGSTDDTAAVVHEYQKRVDYVYQENGGNGAARNAGLRRATGQYVALLDADDVCAPERFDRQLVALAETPDAVACTTGYWRFNDSGRLGEQLSEEGPALYDPLDLLSECLVFPPTLMFDRARAQGLHYPPRIVGADMVFTALLSMRGRFTAVRDPLYGYRSHTRQLTISSRGTRLSSPFFEERYEWARDHWGEHWPDRSWEEIERRLWEGHARQTEASYWIRNKTFFLNDRAYLRSRWPSHLPPPSVLQWRWYPDWLWNAK